MDNLASEGMRFTNFEVAQAICSASRAAILTGCYSNRVGISGALNPHSNIGLNPEEETIAELVKRAGNYATALYGKWHLGHLKPFLPLREGKATSFEGGQRVNCIMKWPAQIPAGSISNKLSSTIDLFPTFAEILGLALPDKKIDGVSILPLMRSEPDASPRESFYYYGQGNALEAVRKDHWKLVFPHKHRTYVGQEPGIGGSSGETSQVEIGLALYDLRRDSGERFEVQITNPEIVQELQKIATAARRDLGDGLLNIEGKNLREPGYYSQ